MQIKQKNSLNANNNELISDEKRNEELEKMKKKAKEGSFN
jgi:hypothetical protein